MISAVILMLSVVALLRFAISQWRALWSATADQPLSDSLRLSTGMDADSIGAGDFPKLLSLCDQLSPELRKSSPWLSEVSLYYRIIHGLDRAIGHYLPGIDAWASREMVTCARFVAVALDQNLAMNLDRRLAARAN